MSPATALKILALEAQESPRADRLVVLEAIVAVSEWCSEVETTPEDGQGNEMVATAKETRRVAKKISASLRAAEQQQLDFDDFLHRQDRHDGGNGQ